MSQTTQNVCDNCGEVLENNYSSWTGLVEKKRYELDLCDNCLDGKIELSKVIDNISPLRSSRKATNLEDFIKMWNNDLTVEEIADKTGLQIGSIYYKAYLARKAGFDVKKRPRGRKAPLHKPSSNGHKVQRKPQRRAKATA